MEWRVDFPPGAYELQLFFYFDSDDGRRATARQPWACSSTRVEQEIVPDAGSGSGLPLTHGR